MDEGYVLHVGAQKSESKVCSAIDGSLMDVAENIAEILFVFEGKIQQIPCCGRDFIFVRGCTVLLSRGR